MLVAGFTKPVGILSNGTGFGGTEGVPRGVGRSLDFLLWCEFDELGRVFGDFPEIAALFAQAVLEQGGLRVECPLDSLQVDRLRPGEAGVAGILAAQLRQGLLEFTLELIRARREP